MKEYGLIEAPVASDEYLFGAAKMPLIQYLESGDWRPFLPKYEPQAEDYETWGCTVWGTQNAMEIFYKMLYQIEPNYSERFNYITAGVKRGGTNPHTVCEDIRRNGVIEHYLLPVPRTFAEFQTPKPMTGSLLARGQHWLTTHDFMHEWVYETKPANYIELLRAALKTSPLGVSVSAWNKVGDTYVSYGDVNNHWCVLVHIDEEGYPWVFDTYNHSLKKLSKDHNIRRAKRIFINKIDRKGSLRHRDVLTGILEKLFMQKTLLEIAESYLGTDASPNDAAPDELSCADTISSILSKKYKNVPTIVSTIKLDEWLPRNGWTLIDLSDARPEDVIVSPTQGTKVGHTGIFLRNGMIASTDSGLVRKENKGKFMQNYTLATWLKRYRDTLGLKVNIYRKTA